MYKLHISKTESEKKNQKKFFFLKKELYLLNKKFHWGPGVTVLKF